MVKYRFGNRGMEVSNGSRPWSRIAINCLTSSPTFILTWKHRRSWSEFFADFASSPSITNTIYIIPLVWLKGPLNLSLGWADQCHKVWIPLLYSLRPRKLHSVTFYPPKNVTSLQYMNLHLLFKVLFYICWTHLQIIRSWKLLIDFHFKVIPFHLFAHHKVLLTSLGWNSSD